MSLQFRVSRFSRSYISPKSDLASQIERPSLLLFIRVWLTIFLPKLGTDEPVGLGIWGYRCRLWILRFQRLKYLQPKRRIKPLATRDL